MQHNSRKHPSGSAFTKSGVPKTFNINALQNRDLKTGMNTVLHETMKLSLAIHHLEESMRKDSLHLSQSLDKTFDYKSYAPLEERALLLGLRLKVIEIKRKTPYAAEYVKSCRYVVKDKFLGTIDVTDQFRSLLNPDLVSTVSIGRVRLVRKSATVKALLSTMPLNVYPNAIKMDIIEKKMFDNYISAGDINVVPDMVEMLRQLRSAIIRYPTKASNSSGVDLRRRKRFALEVVESLNNRFKEWKLQGPLSGLLSFPDLSSFTNIFSSGKFTLEHEVGDKAVGLVDDVLETIKDSASELSHSIDSMKAMLSGVLDSLKVPLVVLLMACSALLACRAGLITANVVTLGLTFVSCALTYFTAPLRVYITPILEALKAYLLPTKEPEQFVLQTGGLDLVVDALCGFAFHGVFSNKISQGGLTAFLTASSAMKKYREGAQFTIEWVSTMLAEFYEWAINLMGKPGWSFSVISPTQVLRNEVNQLVDDIDKDGMFTRNRRFRYESLRLTARDLQAKFLHASKDVRDTEGRAVEIILHALSKLNRFSLPDNNECQTRTETVGINFIGPTGLGKTLMTADIATQVCMESAKGDPELSGYFVRNPESLVYIYDPFANFQSGYRKQFAVCIDDALAMRNGTPSAQGDTSLYAILKYVGALQVDVEQAAIEDKGKVTFDSRILIISTNAVRLELPDMTHPAAVARRFSTYMVWVKDEFCLNPDETNPMNRRLDTTKLPRVGTEPIMTWSHLEFILWNWLEGRAVDGVPRSTYSDVVGHSASRVAINVQKYKDFSEYLRNLASNIHKKNHGDMVLQAGLPEDEGTCPTTCKLVEYLDYCNAGGAYDVYFAGIIERRATFTEWEALYYSQWTWLFGLLWFLSLVFATYSRSFGKLQAIGLLAFYFRNNLFAMPCGIDDVWTLLVHMWGYWVLLGTHFAWALLSCLPRPRPVVTLPEVPFAALPPQVQLQSGITPVFDSFPYMYIFEDFFPELTGEVEEFEWESPRIQYQTYEEEPDIFELQVGKKRLVKKPSLEEQAYIRALCKLDEKKFSDMIKASTGTPQDFAGVCEEFARTCVANGLAARQRFEEEEEFTIPEDPLVEEENIYSVTSHIRESFKSFQDFFSRTPVVKGVLAITGVAAVIFTLLMGGFAAQSGDVKPVKKARSRYAKKNIKNIFVKQGASLSQNFEERYEAVVRKNVFTVKCGTRVFGTATGVRGRALMMPAHFGDILRSEDRDAVVTFEGTQQTFTLSVGELCDCLWIAEEHYEDEESLLEEPWAVRTDLVFVRLPKTCPQFKDISDLFIAQEQLGRFKTFNAIFSKPKFSLGCKARINGHFEMDDEHGGTFMTDSSVRYDCRTRVGDCGNLLWVADSSTPIPYIVSMHVAGNNSNVGMGIILTKETIRVYLDAIEEEIEAPKEEPRVELQSGDFGYKVLREEKAINNSPHHNLVKAETFGQVYPTTKVLSMLRPTEVDGVLINPMDVARSKYGKTQQLFQLDRLNAVAEHVSHKIVSSMGDYPIPEVWTKVDAVKGRGDVPRIPIKTSCGWPLNIEHKGKSDFFGSGEELDFTSKCCRELFSDIDRQVETILDGGSPEHVFMDFLKPETREFEKYKKGATRMISAGPLDLAILTRMYFGSLLSESSKSRITNGFALGVNPYKEWGMLYHKHTRKARGRYSLDGDYANYDGSQEAELIKTFKIFVRAFFYNGTADEHFVREWIVDRLARSTHIVNVGDVAYVYVWEGSNSSGGVLTTLLNMFLNHVAITYGYSVTLQPVKGSGYNFDFTDCMDITVFGDDNLVTVSERLAKRVLPQDFATALAAVGLKYTGADKKELGSDYKSITDCTFLKRGIMYSSDYVAAPLELASIFQPLNWCSKTATQEERRLVIETVLGELALHGKEVYDHWSPKIVNLCTPLYGHLVRATYDRALSDIKGSDFIY
nr:MAG: RNA-dependent RNA polymerase [Chemarfal virus 25]